MTTMTTFYWPTALHHAACEWDCYLKLSVVGMQWLTCMKLPEPSVTRTSAPTNRANQYDVTCTLHPHIVKLTNISMCVCGHVLNPFANQVICLFNIKIFDSHKTFLMYIVHKVSEPSKCLAYCVLVNKLAILLWTNNEIVAFWFIISWENRKQQPAPLTQLLTLFTFQIHLTDLHLAFPAAIT